MKLTHAPVRRARIEIIPLIDVVFFLLATFVMVSMSMITNHGIQINLPASATGSPQEHKDYITLSIKADGLIFCDDKPVDRTELPGLLTDLRAAHEEPRVFIQADRDARWEDTVSVLDMVRQSRIVKIAIETKKPKQ